MSNQNSSDIEPLTRTQILVVMGVTAIILLIIAKVWQRLGSVALLEVELTSQAFLFGMGLSGGIIVASSLIYRLWPAYRQSADSYLELVIKPLVWPDLIWLGLLPGLSEELLFRGVMLPALGFDLLAVIVSSMVFGVLHLSGVQQWPYVVWATVVGFALGYSALVTGNLAIPIVAHIITNWVSSSLWKLGKSQGDVVS
ncbi:CPBP family intramembrane glutamic endopeptidase [Crocosphaera sp. XPORK-15E]|uniref:CPBP family intramembrane glutamic endopeptidase n=1 Tax=Crocosphaera sp. XPORK-15E TaxID=3110247 RepID=UPI002B2158B3|nr:CPBP family intramembrane glutamic endopeptidase [Crocosphaera sp. XPORK-15E]MEA5534546.1 CPBP family intramembrane glutamic endopeptidase [Crocosphaera sp. XPORK-15E]